MRITHPQAPFQGVAPENVFFVANDQQVQLGTGYVMQFFQGEMYPERPNHLFIQIDAQPSARALMFGALLARADQLRAANLNLTNQLNMANLAASQTAQTQQIIAALAPAGV